MSVASGLFRQLVKIPHVPTILSRHGVARLMLMLTSCVVVVMTTGAPAGLGGEAIVCNPAL